MTEPASTTAPNHAALAVRPALLRAVTAIALLGQIVAFYALRQDDPYITFRYAQNLVSGHGLVFNPGERLLGSTAPGHILLSVIVVALFGQDAAPSMMNALGCVAWTAQAAAAYFLLRPAVGVLHALAIAFAVELGAALTYTWISFETSFVSAFALWALLAVSHGRSSWAGFFAGMACLMRPDALILAAVVGAVCLVRERARAWRPALVFAAVFVPWILFATAYYGSPLPQSAVAKFQRADLLTYLAHMLRLVGRIVLPFANAWLAAVLAWLLIALGARALLRRSSTLAPYAAYVALHALAYLVLRPYVGHDWHLYPLLLGAVIFALGGLSLAAQHAGSRPLRVAAGAALALVIGAACVRTALAAASHRDEYWSGGRHDVYLHVARYLREHAREGESFASVEVGTIAYYSDLRAHDMGGLITDPKHARHDPSVRWLVLDAHSRWMAPPWEPVYRAEHGGFESWVFHIPDGKNLTFPTIDEPR